jgi:hypothetical protein
MAGIIPGASTKKKGPCRYAAGAKLQRFVPDRRGRVTNVLRFLQVLSPDSAALTHMRATKRRNNAYIAR